MSWDDSLCNLSIIIRRKSYCDDIKYHMTLNGIFGVVKWSNYEPGCLLGFLGSIWDNGYNLFNAPPLDPQIMKINNLD